MRNSYLHIKYFDKEKKIAIKRKQDFETQSTTYTKTIIKNDSRIVFNEEGDGSNKDMSLIRSVREDALLYMNSGFVPKKEKINFFNLLNIIQNEELLIKVDINSAYWDMARHKKVITQKTDDKFKRLYEGYHSGYAKKARLKALGSTATSKGHKFYKKGILEDEYTLIQPTRQVYLDICGDVDNLMLDLNKNVEGCKYYYWDCMFINPEYAENAVKFLKDRGFNSTSQETTVEYVKIDGKGYIISSSDDKIYMTRKEHGHLLENDESDIMLDNFMLEDYIF